MRSPPLFRWLRWGALLLVLGALLVGLTGAVLWSTAGRRLQREGTLLATARGPVEYAEAGAGPPVLLLHGSPGGYDQLLPLARALARRGYRGITVSRPGYLRTPRSLGSTPRAQADVMATVLDALGAPSAAVVGVSGGGPAALEMALRHPARVRALVLIAAVSGPYGVDEAALREASHLGLGWDLTALAGQASPSLGLRLLGVSDPSIRRELAADPATREAVRYLFGSLGTTPLRAAGYRDDLWTTEALALDRRLGAIGAPTLVLHGGDDESVPLDHGLRVAAAVPGAELEVRQGAGHALPILDRPWLEERLLAFLDRVHHQGAGAAGPGGPAQPGAPPAGGPR